MKINKKYIISCLAVLIFIVIGNYIIKNFSCQKNNEICEEDRRIPKRKYIKIPRRTYNPDRME